LTFTIAIIVLVGLLVYSVLYWRGRWRRTSELLPGRAASVAYVSAGLLVFFATIGGGMALGLGAPVVVPLLLIGVVLLILGLIVFFLAPLPLLPKWLRDELRKRKAEGETW
jgi:hypothetical protein